MQTLSPEDLAYVEKVRRATRRFGDRAAEDLQAALQAVRDTSHFNAEAPTTSARREVELLKTGVKRISAWYMRYMSTQLESFAGSLVRLGDTLLATTDRLTERADEFDGHLGALEQRVRRLEEASRSPGEPDDAQALKGLFSSDDAETGTSGASTTSAGAAEAEARSRPRRSMSSTSTTSKRPHAD